jgi:hypothetical protein
MLQHRSRIAGRRIAVDPVRESLRKHHASSREIAGSPTGLGIREFSANPRRATGLCFVMRPGTSLVPCSTLTVRFRCATTMHSPTLSIGARPADAHARATPPDSLRDGLELAWESACGIPP